MMGHFISCLFEGTLHVNKIHVQFKIANITHALSVPVHPQTNFTPKRWSFRVYMILVSNFILVSNSHSGTTTMHDILWWYHVNKYRAMRGSQSELAPPWKWPSVV